MSMPSVRSVVSLGWKTSAVILLLLLPFVVVQAQSARTEGHVEDKVKAAYLSKFGAYVEWPDEAFPAPDAPLRIGVIDSGNLTAQLTGMVTGRSVNGRQIEVRQLRLGDPLAGLNMLFVGRQNNAQLTEILAAVKTQPTLVVTEAPTGLPSGAMINFVVVDGRLRFQVSTRTAMASRLTISARLLAAAVKVEAGSP